MLRFFLCFYCSVFSFIVLKLKNQILEAPKQNALSLKSKRRFGKIERRSTKFFRRFNFPERRFNKTKRRNNFFFRRFILSERRLGFGLFKGLCFRRL